MVSRIIRERSDIGIESRSEAVAVVPELVAVIDEHALGLIGLMRPCPLIGVHLLTHSVSDALIDAEETQHVCVDAAGVNVVVHSEAFEETVDEVVVVVAVGMNCLREAREDGLVGQRRVGDENVVDEGDEAIRVATSRVDSKRSSAFVALWVVLHDALDLDTEQG